MIREKERETLSSSSLSSFIKRNIITELTRQSNVEKAKSSQRFALLCKYTFFSSFPIIAAASSLFLSLFSSAIK